jgi:hypothetical protein
MRCLPAAGFGGNRRCMNSFHPFVWRSDHRPTLRRPKVLWLLDKRLTQHSALEYAGDSLLRPAPPQQPRTCSGSFTALPGALHGVFFQCLSISCSNRGLSWHHARRRASRYSFCTNVFRDNLLVVVVGDNMHQSLPGNGVSRALTYPQNSQTGGHCSQAEAKDAAPAQTVAHSASEESKTTTHRASLVSATAASHPRRSVCNGPHGGSSLLTEQWRCDTDLRSTRSSCKLALRAGGQ